MSVLPEGGHGIASSAKSPIVHRVAPPVVHGTGYERLPLPGRRPCPSSPVADLLEVDGLLPPEEAGLPANGLDQLPDLWVESGVAIVPPHPHGCRTSVNQLRSLCHHPRAARSKELGPRIPNPESQIPVRIEANAAALRVLDHPHRQQADQRIVEDPSNGSSRCRVRSA